MITGSFIGDQRSIKLPERHQKQVLIHQEATRTRDTEIET